MSTMRQSRRELLAGALVGHAEHDPHDHLEGQRVHPVERRHFRGGSPPVDLGPGDFSDEVAVCT
ncbi:MAG: hypothetical protein ACRDU5_09135 [Mycobacterium sp.]